MTLNLRNMMLSVACIIALSSLCQAEVRIKDLTSVEGARANQLTGLGLVVGLNGTGARSLSTQQMAIDMLRRLEVTTLLARQTLKDNVFKSTNISAVMVTAELSPFARAGSKMDVIVSVLDDATSLEGGTLLLTPLRGADGDVYVVAQGQLSIGGFRIRGNMGGQLNHPTVARAQNGGIVEKEALGQIDLGGFVRLLLRDPDYSTAKSVMLAINEYHPACARAIDAGTIQVRIPLPMRTDVPEFVGDIGLLKIMPDTPARVIINERTGTVIVGHQVRISSVAIAHGNLVIKPNVAVVPVLTPGDGGSSKLGPPPNEEDDPVDDVLKSLRPRPLPGSESGDKPVAAYNVDQTFTVADLARILNALGVSPRDLIAIFQALKESGAMHADLILI